MAFQQYGVSAQGGFFAVPLLSKKVYKEALGLCMFDQFCKVEPAAGKGKGATIDIDKVSRLAASTALAPLVEGDDVPRTTFTVYQSHLDLDAYGAAVDWTEKLDLLAQVVTVSDTTEAQLRRHWTEGMDYLAATAFRASDTIYIPTGPATGVWDEDGTPSTQALANGNRFHFCEIIDRMRSVYKIPPYDADGNYVAIVSTKFKRGLFDDPDFENLAIHAQPKEMFRGEIGTFYGCRVVEETTTLSQTKGLASVLGEAIFFGDEAVVKGVALSPEVRIEKRHLGTLLTMGWVAIMGYACVWDYSSEGSTRIVRVDSS